MPGRRVFFSFHYEQDVWRATNVRNSGKLRRCAEPNSTRKSSSLKRGKFAGNYT
jgi:hypothetical protein